jgi:WhiB family redox-sensing transcriptional regulator
MVWQSRKSEDVTVLHTGVLLSRVTDSTVAAVPCRESDHPNRWFPNNAPQARDRGRAAELCAGCPVLAECLELALRVPASGIWGGMTEFDRLQLIRGRRIVDRKVG